MSRKIWELKAEDMAVLLDPRHIRRALLNAQRTVHAFRVLLAIESDKADARRRELNEARAQLAAMTADRDNQRALWNAAESEAWMGELREQLATYRESESMLLAGADADAFLIRVLQTKLAKVTEQRDRAMRLLKESEPPIGGRDCDSDMSGPDSWAFDIEQLEEEISE